MEREIGGIDTVLDAYSKGEEHQAMVVNSKNTPPHELESYKFRTGLVEQKRLLALNKPRGYKEQIKLIEEMLEAFDVGYSETRLVREHRRTGSLNSREEEMIRRFKTSRTEKRKRLVEEFRRELEVVTAAKRTLLGLGAVAVRSGIWRYKKTGQTVPWGPPLKDYIYGVPGHMGLNLPAVGMYTGILFSTALISSLAIKSDVDDKSIPTPVPIVRQIDESIKDTYQALVEPTRTPTVEVKPTPTPEPTRTPKPTPAPTVVPQEPWKWENIPTIPAPAQIKVKPPLTPPTLTPPPSETKPPAAPKVGFEAAKVEIPRPTFPNDLRVSYNFLLNREIIPSLPPLSEEEAKISSEKVLEVEADGKENGFYYVDIGGEYKKALIFPARQQQDENATNAFYLLSPSYGPIKIIFSGYEGEYLSHILKEAIEEGNREGRPPTMNNVKFIEVIDNTSLQLELTPRTETDRVVYLTINHGVVFRNAQEVLLPDEINNAIKESKDLINNSSIK